MNEYVRKKLRPKSLNIKMILVLLTEIEKLIRLTMRNRYIIVYAF